MEWCVHHRRHRRLRDVGLRLGRVVIMTKKKPGFWAKLKEGWKVFKNHEKFMVMAAAVFGIPTLCLALYFHIFG